MAVCARSVPAQPMENSVATLLLLRARTGTHGDSGHFTTVALRMLA